MAPPIYFFPAISARQLVENDKLAAAVLGPRKLVRTFADIESAGRDCWIEEPPGAGPEGLAGTFLMALPADGSKPARIGYYPDQQTWTRFEEEGEHVYYVGLDNAQPPGPDDLVRKGPNPFDGYPVRLAGHDWLVPVIRDRDEGSGLPRDWQLGADGGITEIIQDTYRELWVDFAAVVDLIFDPGQQDAPHTMRLTPPEAMKHCLQALSLRYRIGRAELNLLRLINSQSWFSVLAAAINLVTFWDVWTARQTEEAKKNSPGEDPAPEGESRDTGPGGPGSDLTIDPAGQS